MPIYTHNGRFGQAVNIAGFVAASQAGPAPGGPLPILNGQNATSLAPKQAGLVNIEMAAECTQAIGLLTCAAVIYASTHAAAAPAAWVHHANVGHVTINDVNAALHGLGGPQPASVVVIFAHPGPSDPGYVASINTIVAQGILAANVVELPNLIAGNFGINNLGMIG